MELVYKTNLTCPVCGFIEELDIPSNYWLAFHTCTSCGTRLRPLRGDCCVFCSFGDHHCINKQQAALARDSKE